MKKNKIYNNLVWIMFLIVGTIFLIISRCVYNFLIVPKSDRVECVATIMEINEDDDNQNITIMYYVDNIIYENVLKVSNSSYFVGEDIIIYYDKNDPSKIVDESVFETVYMFGIMGSIFVSIALIIIYFLERYKRLIIRLKETGYVVNAKYIGYGINKTYTVNNKHPYNIICEWQNGMNGKTYTFKSQNIWFDPEKIINERNLKTFKVYYSPNNLKRYYMDIDVIFDSDGFYK